jgi:primase-polymerase (primpol)-like protein
VDQCLLPDGEIAQWAEPTIRLLQRTYGEVSPSGTGIKFVGKGALDGAGFNRKGLGPLEDGAIECYDCGRFFTLTGRRWCNASEIAELSREIGFLCRMIRPRQTKPKTTVRTNDRAGASSAPGVAHQALAQQQRLTAADEELLFKARRAKNGDRFAALYDHGDIRGYPSYSEADLALMNYLAFWTGADPARMETIFSRSALGRREKWRSRSDYRAWTIGLAIAGCEHAYKPGRPRRRRKDT